MPHSEQSHLEIGKFSVAIAQQLRDAPFGLSPREAEVLTALMVGLNVKEAAACFSVSRHTIDIFKRRIFQKLGVHNAASAAALGMAAIAGAEINVSAGRSRSDGQDGQPIRDCLSEPHEPLEPVEPHALKTGSGIG
ncbi:MAG: helix-turn-helix transcriptional regulator [Parvularcula sp.]